MFGFEKYEGLKNIQNNSISIIKPPRCPNYEFLLSSKEHYSAQGFNNNDHI